MKIKIVKEKVTKKEAEVVVRIEKTERKIEREVGLVIGTEVRVEKGKVRKGKEAEVGIEKGNTEVKAVTGGAGVGTGVEIGIPGVEAERG